MRRFCLALWIGMALLSGVSPARGQNAEPPSATNNPLREHFDAAQKFQAAGDLGNATSEYKLFLAAALHRLATNRAAIGDLARRPPSLSKRWIWRPRT